MSSSYDHGVESAGPSQSFADTTVRATKVDEVEYQGSRVFVYGSINNDLANKAESYKRDFFYVPLLMPVSQQSLSGTTDWVELTKYNKLTIRLTQRNKELEKMIRESLTKKVSESSAACAPSWTIKPLMIDSLNAYIVNGEDRVPGIEPCLVVNPQSVEISLSFSLVSSDNKKNANEVVEKIQQGHYQIKIELLLSRQIEVEKQSGVIIKTVNHEIIVDSEKDSKFNLVTKTSFHNVDVRVYSLNRNKDNSSERSFYFVPLMQPARDEHSADNKTGWIRAVSANTINVQLIQYNRQLKKKIRRKVSKIEQVNNVGDVKPFVIDSLTAHIKDAAGNVKEESCRLSRVNGNMITLRFNVTSSDDAQEIVDKIINQEYFVDVSMWLQIPSGLRTSQVLSSAIFREVYAGPPISLESNSLRSRIQQKIKAFKIRETVSEVKGLLDGLKRASNTTGINKSSSGTSRLSPSSTD